ncbi:MAG: T9SS type A sorting domain-containing protein, partial [Balneolaceae bacterium]
KTLFQKSISILLLLSTVLISEYAFARQISIQDSHPIAIIKTIDSEEPDRFANPSEPGIPAGDLNEDGVEDYIQVIELGRDLRNPDAPKKFITLILTYNENGETIKAASLDGRYLPVGDINKDGLIDVAKQLEDGSVQIVNFRDNVGLFFEEFDRFTISASDIGTLILTEALYNDFNEDGIGDAFLCGNDETSYECRLVLGIDDPNGEQSIFVASDVLFTQQTNFTIPPRIYSQRSIAGTGNSIYAYGYTDDFTTEKFFEFDVDENSELKSVLEYEWEGTSGQALSDRRIYIADIDDDDEPEIISSDDRRFPLSGFVQFFFNDPVCDVREIDFSGDSPAIQSPSVISSNCVIDRTYQNGNGDYYIGIWREGNYGSCAASDFSNGCSNAQFYNDDQTILPCTYESCKLPNQEPGVLLNGVADPSIRSRGIQKWLIENSGELTQQQRVLIPEIFRIAEISTAIALSILGNDAPLQLLRENYFSGITQRDRLCVTEISPCEFNESENYTVYVSVGEVSTESISSSSSSIRGNNYHHYTVSVDKENTERINYNINEERNFAEPSKDLEVSVPKGVGFNKAMAENDTLTYTGEFNLSELGEFEPSSRRFTVKNIGNIDGVAGEEILIGSNSKSNGGGIVNKAWIYLGDNTTYQSPDLVIDFENDSTIDASDFLSVGNVVEPLGDINGDGFNDFAVGLPFYDQRFDGVSYGAVYIFAGGDFSPAKLADSTSLSTPMLILRPGAEAGYTLGSFGSQVAGGDFDGDGFNDIAVLADNGSSSPVSPTIRVYKGGEQMDDQPDYFLHVTKEHVGGSSSDTLTSFFGAVIDFMPEEVGSDHQDLYFTPGGFSGLPDAVIFKGGLDENLKRKGINSPSTTPAITLAEIGPTPTGSGVFLRTKPAIGDFNGDGFYDIVVEKQFDGRDGAVSSRLLVFSPNSGIEVSNEEEISNPMSYRLSQNYPNPFNPSTNIEFQLPDRSMVSLVVYDLLGREVASILNNELYSGGSHTVSFDASRLASGMYIYRLEAGAFSQTRKMLLIK